VSHGVCKLVTTRGFTLIELLIAMSLTVLIGGISYQFIDASLRAQTQGDAALSSLTAIEQTWQLMASDLHSSIDRPVVTPAVGADLLSVLDTGGTGEARRPSMMSAQLGNLSLADLLGRDGALLWFTRHGWVNPLGQPRSELQRVLYRLDNNGNLFRDYWPVKEEDRVVGEVFPLSVYDIERTDPALVKVVEQLGDRASGSSVAHQMTPQTMWRIKHPCLGYM
jgi:type II secretion system protein J